ncbi:MAG: hypothetical protein IPL42_05865 [Saprospiraceae bacterium]|nr:hypothetical protein [Saprospiraceae bacterium]
MAKGYRSGVTPRNVKTASSKEDTLIDIGDVKHHAEDFYEKHKLTILGVLGGLVLVIGGWLLYKFMYQEPKTLKRSNKCTKQNFYLKKILLILP